MSVIDSSNPGSSEHRKKMDRIVEDKIDSRQKENNFTREQDIKMKAKNKFEEEQQHKTHMVSVALQSEIQKAWRMWKTGRLRTNDYNAVTKAIFEKYHISKDEQEKVLSHFKH